MTDAEKESEVRCKAMLNKLIAEVKKQTVEMEDLAVRMDELAVSLKAIIQPPGAPAHALPPPVPAPTTTCVTAVDHIVAAATPHVETTLAPEMPTKCSTSGPNTNTGDLQVVTESNPETREPTVAPAPAEHSSAPSPKSFSTNKQDTLIPTRYSTICPDRSIGVLTSIRATAVPPTSSSTITSPEPTAVTILVRDGTSDLTPTPSGATVHSIDLGDEHVPNPSSCQLGAHKVFDRMRGTDGVSYDKAALLVKDICRNLEAAAKTVPGVSYTVVLRGDSTLCGHFPEEADAVVSVLESGRLIPAGETEFAKDAAFGYRSSHLRQWVEEKTRGRTSEDPVSTISINLLRKEGPNAVYQRLCSLKKGSVCIVNAASERDMVVFAAGMIQAELKGKRILYRTTASFVSARIGIKPKPPICPNDLGLKRALTRGMIVVGSYVPKTTKQVDELQSQCGQSLRVIDVSVEIISMTSTEDRNQEISRVVELGNAYIKSRKDTLVVTSRQLITGETPEESLEINYKVSSALVEIMEDSVKLRPTPWPSWKQLKDTSDGKIVRGLAGLPKEGPAVLVGYHMLMGFELGPLVTGDLNSTGIHIQGLAHLLMFDKNSEQLMPDSSHLDFHRIMGVVPVTAVNFYRLLSEKHFVLLYPGGACEALHRKGEEYELFWPEQSEFVRMASRFGATIIPFGVVGEDDICDVLLDCNDLLKLPFYDTLDKTINEDGLKLRTGSTGEIQNHGLHPVVVTPKLTGRFYFIFGKPIETKGREEELRDKENARCLYLHVKSEVASCIKYLKEKREEDPYRSIVPRLLYQAVHRLNDSDRVQLLHLRILTQQKHGGDGVPVRLGMDVLLIP